MADGREILGKDVAVYFERGGVMLPVACATSCSIKFTTELVARTSVGSGAHKKYKARSMDATATLDGLTYVLPVGDVWTVFQIAQDAIRMRGLNIQMVFTDRQGNYTRITGYVLFPEIDISADATGFAQDSLSMQFSGAPSEFNTPPIDNLNANNVDWNYYIATGGELGFTDTDLIGRAKIALDRNGWLRPINSGSPQPGEFAVNNSTGQVAWYGAASPGEVFFYQYQL